MRGSSTASSRPYSRVSMRRGAQRARRRCWRRTAAAVRRACRRRPARCDRRCVSGIERRNIEASKTTLSSRTSSARYSQRSCVAASSRRPSLPGPATRIRLRESVSHSSARPSMSGAPESTTGVMSRALPVATAGSESARNSSSCRPLSDPAIVVVTASSDCCSLSRSTVSISRAYWQPAHGSASVVSASSSSLVRSLNPEMGPILMRSDMRPTGLSGHSTQRYPMPYTVCTASNFSSTTWNLRRMRLMCEVMVLSSSTTLAASMSCWRFFTWPGCLVSA